MAEVNGYGRGTPVWIFSGICGIEARSWYLACRPNVVNRDSGSAVLIVDPDACGKIGTRAGGVEFVSPVNDS